jgi:flagellar motility protein MotE (MotC chaperone)
MLGLTAAAGLCAAWWLAPIGILLWLIMVVVVARDPSLKITFTRASRQPLAPRFQNRFDQLDRARVSIFNALARANSPTLQKTVEPVQSALDDLVEHAYRLSTRLSALDNNFSVQRVTTNFDDEVAEMQKNLNQASDQASKKEFEATLQSLKTRQAQMKAIGTLLTRFETQLTGTGSAVDGVVTSIVSFQGRDPKQVAGKIPALLQSIQTEQSELKQFDDELDKSPEI